MPKRHAEPVVDVRHTVGAIAILAAIFCVGWCEVRLVWWGIDAAVESLSEEKEGVYVATDP